MAGYTLAFMNTIKRLLLAYVIAVLPFSAVVGLAGIPIGFMSGKLADAIFLYFVVLAGTVVSLTLALLPLSPVIVWAAGRSWTTKFCVMLLVPVFFLVVGLVNRSPLGLQDFSARDTFEGVLWGWVLPAMAVVSFFFVIEEVLRQREPPAAS
jgi:hypothetical protein